MTGLKISAATARWLCAAAIWIAAPPVLAGHGHVEAPLLPAYRDECGSCHIAYAPRLLPAASWERLMDKLAQHFGTDASLETAPAKQIGSWLAQNANQRANSGPAPEDRITRTRWFVREHREVPATVWKRASVGSASNCPACHPRADQGDFNEHSIAIPH